MPYFVADSLRYYFRQVGEGTDLLLLHGFTGQTANWYCIEGELAKRFRLLMVDLPGHGYTDSPDDVNSYRMENVARDVWQLLESLSITAPIVYGYSMGGRLALYLAVHYPIAKLILESSSPGLRTVAEQQKRKKSDDDLADRIEHEDIEAFVQFWENIPLFETQKALSEQIRLQQHQLRLQNHAQGLANSLRGMGTGMQPSLWDHLPALDIPVLLLAGELDTKFVNIARQMHEALPQSQLEVMANAGHTIHIEQTSAVVDAVINFS